MQVTAEKLETSLRQQDATIWIVTGQEPLLVDESVSRIRRHARAQGCDERQVMSAERGFDWSELTAASQTRSLFSDRQLLELTLPGRPDKAGQAALTAYVEAASPENILLLIAAGLDYRDRKKQWFIRLEKAGVVVTANKVSRDVLPRWLQQRAGAYDLRLTAEAAGFMAERCEGNLLAARQELEKLALIAPGRELDAPALVAAITDHARFNAFDLVDSLQHGRRLQAEQRLQYLEASGEELLPLVGLLLSNIRQTLSAMRGLRDGKSPRQALQGAGIFGPREKAFSTALQRMRPAQCHHILLRLQNAEKAFKGEPGMLPAWHYLHQALTLWCR